MRAAIAGAGLVLCVALGACGQHEKARVVVSLEHFASETAAAKTARFAVTVTNDDKPFAGPTTHEAGTFDFGAKSGTIQYDAVGIDEPATSGIIVHNAVYVPMTDAGAIDRNDPCFGKKWGVFDYPKYEREGINTDSDTSPLPFDPDQAVGALKRSNSVLVAVGTENIRGEPATHYRVESSGPSADPWFTASEDDKRSLLKLEVWVDPEARLRRARWTVRVQWGIEAGSEIAARSGFPDEGGHYVETTTADVWDYGVPVNVAQPADSDVCDFPEFFGRTMSTFD